MALEQIEMDVIAAVTDGDDGFYLSYHFHD
jgi:hypothetical protein